MVLLAKKPAVRSIVFEHKIEVFVRFYPQTPPVFRSFEHKIGIFVLEQWDKWHREA